MGLQRDPRTPGPAIARGRVGQKPLRLTGEGRRIADLGRSAGGEQGVAQVREILHVRTKDHGAS